MPASITPRKARSAAAAVVASLLILSACGDADDSTDETGAEATETTTTSEASDEPTEPTTTTAAEEPDDPAPEQEEEQEDVEQEEEEEEAGEAVDSASWQQLTLATPVEAAEQLSDGSFIVLGSPSETGEPGAIYRWSPDSSELTEVGQLAEPRRMPTTTVLADDQILVTGGLGITGDVLATTELVDAGAGTSTVVGSMESPRARGKMAALPDGGAIITGGASVLAIETDPTATLASALATTEVFDPATQTWSAGPDMASGRVTHAVAALPDGDILITGGLTSASGIPMMSASSEIYDAETNSITPAADLPIGGRGELAATSMPDGRILVTGGGGIGGANDADSGGSPFAINAATDAAVFDPATMDWTVTEPMSTARGGHLGFALSDGTIAVVAGDSGSMLELTPTSTVEVYDPVADQWSPLPDLPEAVAGYVGFVDTNGQLVILSGTTNGTDVLSSGFTLQTLQ
ncbi:MAG: kelch repeat-containing protein [Actinomycetota bacterium]